VSLSATPGAVARLALRPIRFVWRVRHDRLVSIGLVFLALALAVTLADGAERWIADFRFEHNHNPARWLSQMASIWDPGRGFGATRSEVYLAPTLFFGLFRGIGLSAAVVQRLFHAALLATVGTGTVALLRAWSPRIGIMHLVAGLYVMFSPFAVGFLLPSGLFLGYAMLPWILLLAVRGIRGDGVWWSAAALTLLVTAMGTVDRGGLLFSTAAVVVLALYLVAVERTATIGSAWAWAWRTAVVGIPALAVSLAGLAFTAEATAQDLRETELANAVSVAASWPESFRGLGFWLLYLRDASGWAKPQTLAYSNERWLYAVTFVVPVVALVALALVRRRERIFFGMLLMAGLVLMVGTHPIGDPSPWGRALGWMYQRLPPSQILRNGYKAGALSTLAQGALVGMAASEFTTRWSRASPTRGFIGRRVLAMSALLAIFAALSQPIWANGLYDETPGYSEIPQYQLDAMAWLDEQPGDARVFFAPGGHRLGFRWGSVNDDILDSYLHRPSVIDTALHTSRPINADIIGALEGALLNRSYEPGLASNLGQRLGIEYIVLRNDVNWQVWGQARPIQYQEFRNDPTVEQVAVFGFAGENTTAFGDVSLEAGIEQALAPVEIYRISDPGPTVTTIEPGPPLLVSGDGEALPLLARNDRLDTTQPVRFTGSMTPSEIRSAVEGGAPVLITDTNRRVVEYITMSQQQGPTLTAADSPVRSVSSLFDVPGSQTVAKYGAASGVEASTSVSISGDAAPWNRPALGIDGSTETTWLVGGLTNPIGERFRVVLSEPTEVSGIRLTAAAPGQPGSRRLAEATLLLSDGSALAARLNDGRYSIDFDTKTLEWVEVVISRLEGAGLGPVGIASLQLVDVDLRESLVLPTDAFRADGTPADFPVGYAFERIIGNGPVDVEREMRREFQTISRAPLTIEGHLRLGGSVPESLLVDLEGLRVSATGSSRFRGLLAFRGNAAVDGDPETAWIVDATQPASLDLTFTPRTVRRLDIRARFGAGFSRLSVVTASIDGRPIGRVEVGEVPCSTSQCTLAIPLVLDEPILGGTTVRLTMESADGAASFERPIRIDEVELNGATNQPILMPGDSGCRSGLIEVDGQSIDIRFDATERSLVQGARTPFTACSPLQLSEGAHRFESASGILVDDVTLLPQSFVVRDRLPSSRTSTITAVDPTTWTGQVSASRGSWLVLRQSFEPSWRATVAGNDLGLPHNVDGFNAWELPNTVARADVRIELTTQRLYEIAQLISLAAVAAVVGIVVMAPRPNGQVIAGSVALGAAPQSLWRLVLIGALATGGYLIGGWLGAVLAGSTALTWPETESPWLHPAFLAAVALTVAAGLGTARDDFGLETFNGQFATTPKSTTTAAMLAGVLALAGLLRDSARARPSQPAHRPTRPSRLWRWAGVRAAISSHGLPLSLGIVGAAAGLSRPPVLSDKLRGAITDAAMGRPLADTKFPGAAMLGAFAPLGTRLAGAAALGVVVFVVSFAGGRLAERRTRPRLLATLGTATAATALLVGLQPQFEIVLVAALISLVAVLAMNRPTSNAATVGRVLLVAAATITHPLGATAWLGHLAETSARRRVLIVAATLALLAPWGVWLLDSP